MIRVGQGFDLHRLEPDRPLMLGGVQIPFERGALGHSDGDVVLHALVDALLGAAGLGDIGEQFPPTDAQWKDVTSSQFVLAIWPQVQAQGWHLANVDITILLEQPKLSPYKVAIQQSVQKLLGGAELPVSVKAKTMEGLGPIGHGDAIAAMATVLLTR